MIDPKLLTEDYDRVLAAMQARHSDYAAALEKAHEAYEAWRAARAELDELRHRLKEGSKKMRTVSAEERDTLRARLKELSDAVKAREEEIHALDEARLEALLHVPNIPLPDVQPGDESANEEVRRWGQIPEFDFTPKPHWEIGEHLGIIDFERAARMSGSRFAVLTGAGARLERAIESFMLDLAREHGYTEVSVPHLVRREAMVGTGQLPHLENDTYKTQDDPPYYLIPTAEVTLVNLHRDEILEPGSLPLYYVAATPCYRAEAGSHGRDVRGLIRQHQFRKVELVKVVEPEHSDDELEKLVNNAEEVLRRLKLPYRVLRLAAGDMGFAAAKTYDLEVWVPSEGKYREISSCSTTTDFQARRAKIRYRAKAGEKPRLVHTLNGSGLAVGRTFLAILENYQNSDGTVTVPEALRPYLGGASLITAEGLK